jgi:hypothetical protein
LVLKGITYEWNDDTTGNDRPTGFNTDLPLKYPGSFSFPCIRRWQRFLQTAYGTYDAMMVEALRYLYMENQSLKHDLVNQSGKNIEIQSLKTTWSINRTIISGINRLETSWKPSGI